MTPATSAYSTNKTWQALVIGRAGMDLYPQVEAGKTRDALGFSADMGGSAGNIAAALGRAGGSVGLISALSEDAIGDFVRQRLTEVQVTQDFIQTSDQHGRTSLAVAEVRTDDCEVVIYRNDAADLHWQYNDTIANAIANSHNLIVTGTSLISEPSRSATLKAIGQANASNCKVWLDLDYRPWNWPDQAATRHLYQQAAKLADVVVGNQEEFAVLTDHLQQLIQQYTARQQIILLKRGAEGCRVYMHGKCLQAGVYPVKALKPYGAGDAFLGNLVAHYTQNQDWPAAVAAGSAAAALVVAKRGCASVMPRPQDIQQLQQSMTMTPSANWT
ncbi:MAG: PfkB family carbohydrate kinase [Gammaproteobacteria bacterium]|nr:PfkB family carbohydrate kinase [Gammaproteobacteria bacterium]